MPVESPSRDPVVAAAERYELGRIERRFSLDGRLSVPGGDAPAELCTLVSGGAWLVAALDAERARVLDVVASPEVAYDTGRFRDAFRVGEAKLGVPRSRRSELVLALARARFGAARTSLPVELDSRYLHEPSEVERAWLRAQLEPGEVLLAWLPTATSAQLESPLAGALSLPLRFVLTSRRTLLLAVGELGDVRCDELPSGEPAIDGGPRPRARLGPFEWRVPLGQASHYRELAPAVALDDRERVLAVARLNWLHGRPGGSTRARARQLTEELGRAGEVRATIAAYLIAAEQREAPGARPDPQKIAERLRETGAAIDTAAAVWKEWRTSTRSGRALVARLRSVSAEPWALVLHRSVHDRRVAEAEEPLHAARADADLAEHLIATGERDEAVRLLHEARDRLPAAALDDLLPLVHHVIRNFEQVHAQRVRIHELLVHARGDPDVPDAKAITALARLEPLDPARIRALATDGLPQLRQRASVALEVLAPGGTVPGEPTAGVRQLAENLIETRLRHPLSRDDGALVVRMQELLAETSTPDTEVLRDYCERLTDGAAARALDAAARMLGVEKVEGYVSRGKKSIGVRAFEGRPPFVLVGGRHVDEGSEYRMSELELRFAIGTEVAHIRYGHGRVTSMEVWAGALDKGKQGLDLAVGFLPAMKGWKIASRVDSLTQPIRSPLGQRLLRGAGTVGRALKTRLSSDESAPEEEEANLISPLNEQLVAAHRVMQLTADRAGLLLAGELGPVLRAMMLVRPEYREALHEAERRGLVAVLDERAPSQLAFGDLRMRVGSLISFYLSEEYSQLEAAVREHSPRQLS